MKTDHVDSLARGLIVRASSSVEDRQLVAGWLEAEHFLGALRAVGHTLIQFVQQENQVVAVAVLGPPPPPLQKSHAMNWGGAAHPAQPPTLMTNKYRLF